EIKTLFGKEIINEAGFNSLQSLKTYSGITQEGGLCPNQDMLCSPVYASFSGKSMIVSANRYANFPDKSMFVYQDYLNDNINNVPIPLTFGQPYTTYVDPRGNFIVQDHTWSSILIFKPLSYSADPNSIARA
ncbi:MAG: hypothetical protein KKF44_03315, partial [Nanoarchaeota archaeon]|nr:hypothetical protein [Nanoarchaeota archaeon]